ncbi:hypothetical protein LCGC14_0937360 [marine sediment metagenome]|uniref:Uncharacterized protein n=1 Tax=marine sediment metagenome TaxID=412755 RepID=A0A0F9NQT9_9ZZZZ|nr:hypothetical protein [Actinomycetota bacterium]
MKTRLLITVLISIVVTFFAVSSALAGGWHVIGPTHDPDAGNWGDSGQVPHLGLSTSSNQCKTCHAVHNADNTGFADLGDGSTGTGQQFKLLRNESRQTECYFCHGPNGALTTAVKKPYADMYWDDDENPGTPDVVADPKGEHTLGATAIPDSTVDASFLSGDGLSCGNCHSVHGSWTLNGVAAAGTKQIDNEEWVDDGSQTDPDADGEPRYLTSVGLDTRILRRDPAQNGGDASLGVINVASPDANNDATDAQTPAVDLTQGEVLAGFCGDCHNKNVNWSTGGNGEVGETIGAVAAGGGTVAEGSRPNSYAHPLGELDGLIDIYGKLGRVESEHHVEHHSEDADGGFTCWDCHESRQEEPSKFPHRTQGHKLLNNEYTDTSAQLDTTNYQLAWDSGTDSYTGDPNRPLPELDEKVCRECHGAGMMEDESMFPGIGVPDAADSF